MVPLKVPSKGTCTKGLFYLFSTNYFMMDQQNNSPATLQEVNVSHTLHFGKLCTHSLTLKQQTDKEHKPVMGRIVCLSHTLNILLTATPTLPAASRHTNKTMPLFLAPAIFLMERT